MSIVLVLSIMIRLIAVVWSVYLLQRIRDWRIGFLTIMLALMTLRQILALKGQAGAIQVHWTGTPTNFRDW